MFKTGKTGQFLNHAAKNPVWWVGAGTTLFFVSLLVACSQTVGPTEESILRALYNLPQFLTPLFISITLLGSAWTVATILVFYLWRKRRKLTAYLALNVAAAYVVAVLTKLLVNRSRPPQIFSDIVAREPFTTADLGFPSAHAAVSTALALALLPILPRRHRWIVPAWIILVALSRVHLGVHAPIDVVGGVGIGLLAAGFVRIIGAQKSNKPAATPPRAENI